LTRFMTELK